MHTSYWTIHSDADSNEDFAAMGLDLHPYDSIWLTDTLILISNYISDIFYSLKHGCIWVHWYFSSAQSFLRKNWRRRKGAALNIFWETILNCLLRYVKDI